LSQRQAAFALQSRDVPIDIGTIQQWEQGRCSPRRLAVKALEDFLARFPVIDDVPVYRKGTKFTAEDLAEIRRLRSEGQTMAAIAQRFNVDQSYISRIVSGERLAKAA
jgi:transcriptional regulator with XRE-family HTH domain